MKPRTLSRAIERAIRTFPAFVVTGPRQYPYYRSFGKRLVKSSMTAWPKYADPLERLLGEIGGSVRTAGVISRAAGDFPLKGKIWHYHWRAASYV